MKTGFELINQERQEQIEKHGYSKEFQEANMQWYDNGQLIRAARFCEILIERHWPDDWQTEARDKIKSKDRVGQLACAGAFYLAHMELFGRTQIYETCVKYCASAIDEILKTRT